MSEHETFHLGIKALIRNKEGEILLLKKSKKITDKYGGKPYWDIPGGRIEKGCSVVETLKREVLEEVGVGGLVVRDLFYAVVSNIRIDSEDCGLILFIYDCSVPEKSKIILDEEHSEYGWFDRKDAVELLKVKYPINFVDKIRP